MSLRLIFPMISALLAGCFVPSAVFSQGGGPHATSNQIPPAASSPKTMTVKTTTFQDYFNQEETEQVSFLQNTLLPILLRLYKNKDLLNTNPKKEKRGERGGEILEFQRRTSSSPPHHVESRREFSPTEILQIFLPLIHANSAYFNNGASFTHLLQILLHNLHVILTHEGSLVEALEEPIFTLPTDDDEAVLEASPTFMGEPATFTLPTDDGEPSIYTQNDIPEEDESFCETSSACSPSSVDDRLWMPLSTHPLTPWSVSLGLSEDRNETKW